MRRPIASLLAPEATAAQQDGEVGGQDGSRQPGFRGGGNLLLGDNLDQQLAGEGERRGKRWRRYRSCGVWSGWFRTAPMAPQTPSLPFRVKCRKEKIKWGFNDDRCFSRLTIISGPDDSPFFHNMQCAYFRSAFHFPCSFTPLPHLPAMKGDSKVTLTNRLGVTTRASSQHEAARGIAETP